MSIVSDGRSIIQEVLQSLAHEAPLEEMLDLISRRVLEAVGFSFCCVLAPVADRRHIQIAGSYRFPEHYAQRLNDLFMVPAGDRDLPTLLAMQHARTVVVSDALVDEAFRPWRNLAIEFGYRALVSVPLSVESQVIGVLNGYSAQPREFTPSELLTVETLAAQAAVALRLTTLMEARDATIAKLRDANDDLEHQRSVLERAHQIHLRLTTAVIDGADFQAIANVLAELIDRPVAVTDTHGRVICTSNPAPDQTFIAQFEDAVSSAPADSRIAGVAPVARHGEGTAHPSFVGQIRVGEELLGYVVVREGDAATRDLDLRAVEHATTVLALEIVKERVVRATEERLQADLLTDLLHRREMMESHIVERARQYGLEPGVEHRMLVVELDDWPGFLARTRTSPTQLDPLPRVVGLMARYLAERLPGTLVSEAGERVIAAVRTADVDDPVETLHAVVGELRQRVQQIAPGLSLSGGIGRTVQGPTEFAKSFHDAERCLDVLRRTGSGGRTIATDELGILALFVDSTRPDELMELAYRVLGPAIERDAASGGALMQTLDVYLEHNCDMRACAEALYVHVNTVKYRLRRVQELCALNLRDPTDLLQAKIATLTLKLI